MRKWMREIESTKQFSKKTNNMTSSSADTTMTTNSSSSSSSSSSSRTSTASTTESTGSRKPIVNIRESTKPSFPIEHLQLTNVQIKSTDNNNKRRNTIINEVGSSTSFNATVVDVKSNKTTVVVANGGARQKSFLDWRYVTSFHGFLKVTTFVSCLGAASCIATIDQCWFEVAMSLQVLRTLSIVSAAWTLLIYGGHLIYIQRRLFRTVKKTSSAIVFTDVVLSAFSFVSMIVASFVMANSGCQIETTSINGSAFFGIFASILFLINFTWLVWKYYLDCSLISN